MSKKITLATSEAGVVTVAKTEEVSLIDYVSTLFSTDVVLTGTANILQKAGLIAGGMVVSSQLIAKRPFAFIR